MTLPNKTTGTGLDSLVLLISDDAWANNDGTSDAAGDATFTVAIDGKQQGGTFTAGASHAAGADQSFTFNGYFGTGSHTVTLTFLNDAYGGSPSTDRNLYVDGLTYEGVPDQSAAAALYANGGQSFTFSGGTLAPVTVTTGSGSHTLTLVMSEDAYKGNAQFTITVDGKRQGGTFTATALHAAGAGQDFIFNGNWASGDHTVSVNFLNDLYGGTPSADRNLYVNDITYDGTDTKQSSALFTTGSMNFRVTASTPIPTVLQPSARGGYLLPSGYLSTAGSQIVDSNGNPVRIDSVAWYGCDGSAGSTMQGLWATRYENVLQSIKQDGFNTIRIAWSDVNLNAIPTSSDGALAANPGLLGLTNLQIYQKIVSYAGQLGLKIIFDHHTDDGSGGQQPNGLWIDKGPGTNGTDGAGNVGTVDAAKFQQDWVQLASTFKGNPTVIGYDLDNEPIESSGLGGSPDAASWGGGGPDDIHAMYQTVGNAVEAADPGALIIAEGPIGQGFGPNTNLFGFDLTQAKISPVTLNTPNKLVYSVHEYPSEIGGEPVDSGAAAVSLMNQTWGYLVSQNLAPVWIGEMGSNMTSADSQAWAATLLAYMNGKDGAQGGPTFTGNQQPVGGDWWNAGWENGTANPGGIQNAWGLGNYRPEQQAITDQMLFKPL